MCSLHDLRTVISLEEVYQMDEIITIDRYHEWLAARQARQDQG
ncbi:hypothetical protein [uncultured Sutterella sp.]|nr:hypothetical protein [uncultured Sutterella sp.]DAL55786.1 MAG TPA_asm: hypothetical protein [Caudoviricetes sp.]